MSKLSKFKFGISPAEAAVLLSRLIGETISVEDINNIHAEGWITAQYNCSATLVKLKFLDENSSADPGIVGPWLLEAENDCGICYAFDLPMDLVEIKHSGLAYVMLDAEGNHYALRDNSTQNYINASHDNLPYFEDAWLAPEEIYELACLANNDKPIGLPNLKIKEQKNCLSGVTLYNYQPGAERPAMQPAPFEVRQPQEPPSLILAVAALAEIATNGVARKRNQSSLIEEILDNYKFRGLSKSNLEKMLSQANRLLAEARTAKV
jgi:hypothetical protein